MKKFLLTIQIVSSVLSLVSKYFLATENIWGWWIAVFAYILVAIYNAKANLKIYSLIGVSLALLTFYGGCKWSAGIQGLGLFDYIVVAATIFTTFYFAIQGSKFKKPLWIHQTVGVAVFMASFLLLGWGIDWGWLGLAIGHAINVYIYFRGKAYW